MTSMIMMITLLNKTTVTFTMTSIMMTMVTYNDVKVMIIVMNI